MLERKPDELDVMDGPIERAPQLDEPFHRGSDHFGLRHVFALTRHVVDRLRFAIEIPLARLVEQFQGVFQVDAP